MEKSSDSDTISDSARGFGILMRFPEFQSLMKKRSLHCPPRLLSTLARAITMGYFALAGCSFGETRPLLIDLNFYDPLIAYSPNGYVHRALVEFCRPSVSPIIRDVTPDFVLVENPPFEIAEPLSGRHAARFPWVPQKAKDVRLSPRGDRLVFAGRYPLSVGGCNSGIALASAGGQVWESLWCSPAEGELPAAVSWSRDQAKLAFSYAGDIYIMNLADRKTKVFTSGEWPRWSPIDGRLAFIHGESIVVIQSEARLSQPQSVQVPGLIASGVEWPPDGSRLSLVHKTLIQPGDSRISTTLAILDPQQWTYHDVRVQMWGSSATLRWTSSEFKEIERAQSEACKSEALFDGNPKR